jgi:hypothetical protein
MEDNMQQNQLHQSHDNAPVRKAYRKPELKKFGEVAELTKGGYIPAVSEGEYDFSDVV